MGRPRVASANSVSASIEPELLSQPSRRVDTGRVKPIDAARARLPAEGVIAAGSFVPAPRTTGITTTGTVTVAMTPDRLFVLEGSRRRGLQAQLGMWDQRSVMSAAEIVDGATRLILNPPADGVWLDLRSVRGGAEGAAAADVARRLTSSVAGLAPPVGGPRRVETEESRRLHRRAGRFALAGGVVRLLAYMLPWAVLARVDPATTPYGSSPSVSVSGAELFGSQPLSLLGGLAAVLLGLGHLLARRRGAPVLIAVTACAGVVIFAIQFVALRSSLPVAQRDLSERGIAVSVRAGSGVWIELVGVLLIVAAAIDAVRAYRAMLPLEPVTPTPDRPDLPAAVGPQPAGVPDPPGRA